MSRTTASNAWSRPDQLSADLRERILAAADELGYPGPHPAARSLRSGRAGAVGVVLTEQLSYAFGDPYALELVRGIAAHAERIDAGLLCLPLPPGGAGGAAVERAVIDGAIVYSVRDGHPVLDALTRRGLPLVCVDQPRLDGVPWVGIDDRRATAELTSRVLDAGHRRILALSFRVAEDEHAGPLEDVRRAASPFRVTRERLAGIDDAVEAHRGNVELSVREARTNLREHGREQVRAALEADPITAVIALSDELALGAMQAAREVGLSVPGQLSVVGFDDVADAARHGLTTVANPSRDKGRVAAELLLAPEPAPTTMLTHRIIERTSLASPPS